MKSLMVLYASILLIISSCSRPAPYTETKYNIGLGMIIAKETCTGDDATEYWVIDLYHPANTWYEGDSLFLNGITYYNVVKIIISNPNSAPLKKIGQKVAFDFEKILPPQNTRTCTVANSIVYPVKQLTIRAGGVGDLRG